MKFSPPRCKKWFRQVSIKYKITAGLQQAKVRFEEYKSTLWPKNSYYSSTEICTEDCLESECISNNTIIVLRNNKRLGTLNLEVKTEKVITYPNHTWFGRLLLAAMTLHDTMTKRLQYLMASTICKDRKGSHESQIRCLLNLGKGCFY